MDQVIGSVASRVFLLLALAAAALLFWYWYSNDRMANTFTALTTANNELWPAYRYQPSRFGTAVIPASTIIKLKALPESEISGTALINGWGGTWQFTGATNNLRAAIDGVPDSDCTRLISRFPPSTGITQIRVAGNLSAVGSATLNTAPVDAATAATLCASGTNAIEFMLSHNN